jgi:hypothetical protein
LWFLPPPHPRSLTAPHPAEIPVPPQIRHIWHDASQPDATRRHHPEM